jgi:Ca-activated chloride channel family protein
MIEALHFLRPAWLAAVPAGWALVWVWRRRARLAGGWLQQVDPALQPYVLASAGEGARGSWPAWLAAAAVLIGGIALAGPAWERLPMPAVRAGDAMVIALDLSRSMDASDINPSRLARARLKLRDILRARAGGETALVVYSANAFTVTPLTDDVDTIGSLINTLSPSLMPSRGSYPSAALTKAERLLEQAQITSGRVLLIADGGVTRSAEGVARRLRDAGHSVSVLAIGTEEGGPIPLERGGFVTDDAGNIALPKTDFRALQRLATAGGGKFARLTTDGSDLRALDVAARASNELRDDRGAQQLDRWADAGPWFLLLTLPLVALSFRRGWYAMGAFVLLLPGPRAEALTWQDLWATPDQQGVRLLEQGEPASAAEVFDDPAWRGSAAYRAGSYERSAEAFAALDGADARYNQGNALARAGEFDAAIAAYEAALEIEPEHEDARHNLELLRALQDQQSGEDQQGQQGDPSQQSGEQREQQSGDGEPQGQPEPGEQDGEPSQQDKAGESARQSAASDAEQADEIEALQQAMREAEAAAEARDDQSAPPMTMAERQMEEQEQALEQWLRRIPDDPGGLLRRKFRYQYRRQGVDQDGNELWPDDRAEPW